MDPMELPVLPTNDLESAIVTAFLPYDANNNKLASCKDCGDILRNLGCVPTERDIEHVATSTEFEPGGGEMHLAHFMPLVADLITKKRMAPATTDQLLQMFEILDRENRRYFTKEELTYYMTEFEEQFTEQEMKDMMSVALDPTSNTIPYEFYINKLIFTTENSIYDIAETIEAERIAAIPQSKKIGDMMKF